MKTLWTPRREKPLNQAGIARRKARITQMTADAQPGNSHYIIFPQPRTGPDNQSPRLVPKLISTHDYPRGGTETASAVQTNKLDEKSHIAADTTLANYQGVPARGTVPSGFSQITYPERNIPSTSSNT